MLLHVKGATSFENLRTVNCVIYPTFYKAAVAKHLVNEDEEWDRCLKEATQVQLSTALRELFSFICIYHNPINARELYEKYKIFFYNSKYEKSIGENIALNIIHKNLQINGYSLTDFKLPDISTYIEEYNDETFYEKFNTLNEVHLKINTLKTNQKIYSMLFCFVCFESLKQRQKNCIFIDGPGGSGRSYLLNILIDYLKFYDNHFYV